MLYLFYLLNFFSLNLTNDWVYIFNGKNLDGWEIKIRNHNFGDNFKNTFKVKEGSLWLECHGQTLTNNLEKKSSDSD